MEGKEDEGGGERMRSGGGEIIKEKYKGLPLKRQ
jgi:hypothetical protein